MGEYSGSGRGKFWDLVGAEEAADYLRRVQSVPTVVHSVGQLGVDSIYNNPERFQIRMPIPVAPGAEEDQPKESGEKAHSAEV